MFQVILILGSDKKEKKSEHHKDFNFKFELSSYKYLSWMDWENNVLLLTKKDYLIFGSHIFIDLDLKSILPKKIRTEGMKVSILNSNLIS
jgi:hypothetical protein